MRIDAHAHVTPPAYLDAVPFVPVPAPLDGLRAFMDRHAIDRAIVSTGPPGAPTAAIAERVNDDLACVVRDDPTTFAALAALPLRDPAAAVAEAVRALDELELDGVLLLASVDGVYLGDPAYDELFAELDRRGAYAFLHPSLPPYDPPLPGHPVWLYEFVFETTRAVANLVFSGTLERCPNMRLQLAHLGGTVPFVAHRIASLQDREPEKAVAAPAGTLAYLRRLYYDTGLAGEAPALEATLAVTDPTHLVFGSDWPYLHPPAGRDPAPGMECLGEMRPGVDGGNARALVRRWQSSAS